VIDGIVSIGSDTEGALVATGALAGDADAGDADATGRTLRRAVDDAAAGSDVVAAVERPTATVNTDVTTSVRCPRPEWRE
jgi:hypothetical protein